MGTVIATAPMVTEMTSTALPVKHAPISYAWERRKPEPHGFIDNLNRTQISGCLP